MASSEVWLSFPQDRFFCAEDVTAYLAHLGFAASTTVELTRPGCWFVLQFLTPSSLSTFMHSLSVFVRAIGVLCVVHECECVLFFV